MRRVRSSEYQQPVVQSCDSVCSKYMIPVIKLHEPMTFGPIKNSNNPVAVVRMQNLLTSNGKEFRPLFWKIKNAGGIHEYLGFRGTVIFSTIMRDHTIHNCPTDNYIYAVNNLHPDFFTTLDGETYENERRVSGKEIERTLSESKKVIRDCHESIPIGLVKGSTVSQNIWHTNVLLKMGVNAFVFHIGDFIHRSESEELVRARMYIREIRKRVPFLLLYGLSSSRYLREFWSADGFITQSHYINAFMGKRLVGSRWESFGREVMTNRYRELRTSKQI